MSIRCDNLGNSLRWRYQYITDNMNYTIGTKDISLLYSNSIGKNTICIF